MSGKHAALAAIFTAQHPALPIAFHFHRCVFNNFGVPLPGETIPLGAGLVFAKFAASLGPRMVAGTSACFLGGVCSFWPGRRLGHSRLERIYWLHLSPASAKWPEQFFKRFGAKVAFIARFSLLVSTGNSQSVCRHVENAMAHLSLPRSHGIGGLYRQLSTARLFFREKVENY